MIKKIAFGVAVASALLISPLVSLAQIQGDVAPPQTSNCVVLQNNLRYRSTDAQTNGEVSILQDFLQGGGYLNSEPTGFFGRLTLNAVKAFQGDNDILNNDVLSRGFVGPLTRLKIMEVSCGGNTSHAGALTISVPSTPPDQTIVAGSQGVTFANYRLDASQSGEGLWVSPLNLLLTVGGNANQTDLSMCQIFDGSTALNTGSNIINPASAAKNGTQVMFTLDNMLRVVKGTIKTLTLKCNVGLSAANGSLYSWGLSSAQGTNVVGDASRTIIPPTVSASNGSVVAIAAGTLTVTTDPASPAYSLAVAGSSGVVLGIYKFAALNDNITLNRIGVNLGQDTSASEGDLAGLSLWANGAQIGTITFAGGASNAISTPLSLIVPKNGSVAVVVKADLAPQGSNLPSHPGALLEVNVDTNNTQGILQGNVIGIAGSTNVSGVRVFRTVPTVARITPPSSLLVAQAGVTLYQFRVTANPANDLALRKFVVSVVPSPDSTTNGKTWVSNLKVYAYTDPYFTNGVAGFIDGQLAVAISNPVSGNNAITFPVLMIPKGQTYYFQVKGTVAQMAGTTGSAGAVTTYLAGDPSYAFGTESQISSSNFIWSPMSQFSMPDVYNADWTNGFGVPGLPSGGPDAFTLSKDGALPTQTPTPATITVTFPNGGENLVVGQTYVIRWTSQGNNISGFYINYANLDQHYINPITSNIPGGTSSYSWTIPSNIIPGRYSISVLNGSADGTATVAGTSNTFNIVAPPTTTGPTVTLTVNGKASDRISTGGSATLHWTTENATTCYASGPGWNWIKPAVSSDQETLPFSSLKKGSWIYALSCGGPGGSNTAQVELGFVLPSIELSTAATTVDLNKGTTLYLNTTNADSCTITDPNLVYDGFAYLGRLTLNVPPLSATKTYTVTCTGPGGEARQSVTINVKPTLEFTVNDKDNETMTLGSTAVYKWEAKNATSCSNIGTGTSNPVVTDLKGSITTTPVNARTFSYTMTCTGPGGTVTKETTLNVVPVGSVSGISSNNNVANVSSALPPAFSPPGVSGEVNTSNEPAFWFVDDIYHGMRGNNVFALQRALLRDGDYGGPISGNFYDQTYDAVLAFQNKYGISATGYVGPSTRAQLNSLFGQ